VKGRKRAGGIRFGEMERDAIIAHGCSYILRDRLMMSSDRCTANVCQQCGMRMLVLVLNTFYVYIGSLLTCMYTTEQALQQKHLKLKGYSPTKETEKAHVKDENRRVFCIRCGTAQSVRTVQVNIAYYACGCNVFVPIADTVRVALFGC
jgi:hypothetical protein